MDKNVITVAIVHDLSLALRFADNIAFMKDGKILRQCPSCDVTAQDFKDTFDVNADVVEINGKKRLYTRTENEKSALILLMIIVTLSSLFAFSACDKDKDTANGKTVTDLLGREVTVPEKSTASYASAQALFAFTPMSAICRNLSASRTSIKTARASEQHFR